MKQFLNNAAQQHHPLKVLESFLSSEAANEVAKKYEELRFVGYVLEIGFETLTLITSDQFKVNVGGIPRNSLLIMVPAVAVPGAPLNFTLLRVLEAASTPLSSETQQTYFELQKSSMPELDIFTQSELQWGALKASVLGMFYPHPEKADSVEFSGDVNNFVSAHKYKVYAPDETILRLVVNTLVPQENRFDIGDLRLTECRLPIPSKALPAVKVCVSTRDFMGSRTAMFGKTRLGKSNVVKMIAQSLIETTSATYNVGQLIFDINGEYANDNPQDGNVSLATAYAARTTVYALTPKPNTPSKPLKLNFYEFPEASLKILSSLMLADGGKASGYIESFLSVELPSWEEIDELTFGDKLRAQRKVLIYWAILHRAGFSSDLAKLKAKIKNLDPKFAADILMLVYPDPKKQPDFSTLDGLADAFVKLADRDRQDPKAPLASSSGKPLFDPDDRALLEFLHPRSSVGSGPRLLQPFRPYHDKAAGDFVTEILASLDAGCTVILDLGNAPPTLLEYFSRHLSNAVFARQVEKFTTNTLGDKFVQLYFEEAHNLFAPSDTDAKTAIYRRLAKEGAKYQIGMVYSTQSVSSVSKDLLAQTENFFIAHMSSRDEVNALAKVNVAYDSLREDIMLAKTPGYMRMLTRSHRFVVPMQAHKFEAKSAQTTVA